MPLSDRGTRAGYLDPVIIADVEKGTLFRTQPADTSAIDAFARQRFSEPHTIYDSKQIWNDPGIADSAENYPLFWDNQEVSGSGTATLYNNNRASTTLSVSAFEAGKRVRQSKEAFNYQTGKGQFIVFTFVDMQTGPGITKDMGLLNDDNGVFIRSKDGVKSVVTRSFTSGAPVDTVFEQEVWNTDKLNGKGGDDNPSGLNLNLAMSQIPFIDFEWLGTGRVRFGWFMDGIPIYCHRVNNANNLDVVYMSSPNLPFRATIENDGTGGAASLETLCVSVISEGGVQPSGTDRGNDTGVIIINTNVVGTTYALVGIRLKDAYLSADVRETGFTLLERSAPASPFLWKVHLNPTLTTGLTFADEPNSAVQFGIGIVTGDVITADGTILRCGYASSALEFAEADLQNALRLGSFIDDTPDEIVLSTTPITQNQDFLASINWRESW